MEPKKSCCALEEKKVKKLELDTSCCSSNDRLENHGEHDHNHSNGHDSTLRMFLPSLISFLLLLVALLFDNYLPQYWFKDWIRIVWYIIAYIPVGIPVLKEAYESIIKGAFFSEFFLMGIATVGAFGIGQYAEGVAVMLFYAIGELFQMLAVNRAKSNIKLLLDQRPDLATVIEGVTRVSKKASDVNIGAVVELKPGEKLALDGILLSN